MKKWDWISTMIWCSGWKVGKKEREKHVDPCTTFASQMSCKETCLSQVAFNLIPGCSFLLPEILDAQVAKG